MLVYYGCQNNRYNNTQHNDTQHNYKNVPLRKCYAVMLSVTIKHILLSEVTQYNDIQYN